jgi:DivIVA domain-containing protein
VAQFWLILAVALTAGAILFGVVVLASGDDRGLRPVEPDGRSIPLPGRRPLAESDFAAVRFEVALRGYRMAEVDAALRRAAYDIGYKDELIEVLQAEVDALRAGRMAEAEALRRAREAALAPVQTSAEQGTTAPEDEDAAQDASHSGSTDQPDPGPEGTRSDAKVDPASTDSETAARETTASESTDPEHSTAGESEDTGSEARGTDTPGYETTAHRASGSQRE